MLKQNKLLIDRDCPLCKAYGQCFLWLGLVDGQTLTTYQSVEASIAGKIDMDRARNEIALHDTASAHTIYGLDALLKIASHKNTLLKSILHFGPIYFLLSQLYNVISYNRKVIYPAPTNTGRVCEPDLNLFYRWVYILFVAIATGVILNQFVFLLNTALGWPHNWMREYIICFGQIAWQGTVISSMAREKSINYLGNMSTVSMIGGFMLLPLFVLNEIISFSVLGFLAYFGVVVSFMLMEHIRRCKLLGISIWMTISWVAYRMVVLLLILLPWLLTYL